MTYLVGRLKDPQNLKFQAQENDLVDMFEYMTNASVLIDQMLPLAASLN